MTRPWVIGIGGGSASGKSTLARRLEEALVSRRSGLSVRVMPMDTYFRAEKPLHRGPLSGREWPDFNQPASFHLDRLLADLEAATEEVVIVEGLMVLVVEEVRERCHLKLFVDAPADERVVRRLRRNMAERGLSFDEIAGYYLESVRFRHAEFVEPSRWQADLVVNGVLLTETAVRVVADHVLAAVERVEAG
jgi:uridine kinase